MPGLPGAPGQQGIRGMRGLRGETGLVGKQGKHWINRCHNVQFDGNCTNFFWKLGNDGPPGAPGLQVSLSKA